MKTIAFPSCSNNFDVAAALFNIAPSGAKLPNKTIPPFLLIGFALEKYKIYLFVYY